MMSLIQRLNNAVKYNCGKRTSVLKGEVPFIRSVLYREVALHIHVHDAPGIASIHVLNPRQTLHTCINQFVIESLVFLCVLVLSDSNAHFEMNKHSVCLLPTFPQGRVVEAETCHCQGNHQHQDEEDGQPKSK